MNKDEYQERSRKLRVPQRCPLVGYCKRWAFTVWAYSYSTPPDSTNDFINKLRNTGDLPDDYEDKEVTFVAEYPEIWHDNDREDPAWSGTNLCPEVSLFDRFHTPMRIPLEAVTSFSWFKSSGMNFVEHKHFSECLEFIRNNYVKPRAKRKSLPPKLRFQVLRRDNFTCTYCGKSADDGATLHIDHKISIKDGGSDDPKNLVTSCADCNVGKGANSLSIS